MNRAIRPARLPRVPSERPYRYRPRPLSLVFPWWADRLARPTSALPPAPLRPRSRPALRPRPPSGPPHRHSLAWEPRTAGRAARGGLPPARPRRRPQPCQRERHRPPLPGLLQRRHPPRRRPRHWATARVRRSRPAWSRRTIRRRSAGGVRNPPRAHRSRPVSARRPRRCQRAPPTFPATGSSKAPSRRPS